MILGAYQLGLLLNKYNDRLRENKGHSRSVIWRKMVSMESTCHVVYDNIYYIFYVRIIGRKILRYRYYPINDIVVSQR